MRLLIFLGVISFTHSPQNTVVTIFGQFLPPAELSSYREQSTFGWIVTLDFDPAQREKLPKVGSIGHIAVTINQVTVGRRHGLFVDTLVSKVTGTIIARLRKGAANGAV